MSSSNLSRNIRDFNRVNAGIQAINNIPPLPPSATAVQYEERKALLRQLRANGRRQASIRQFNQTHAHLQPQLPPIPDNADDGEFRRRREQYNIFTRQRFDRLGQVDQNLLNNMTHRNLLNLFGLQHQRRRVPLTPVLINMAMGGLQRVYGWRGGVGDRLLVVFLNRIQASLENNMNEMFHLMHGYKVYFSLSATYHRLEDGVYQEQVMYTNRMFQVNELDGITNVINFLFAFLIQKVGEFHTRGSGWSLVHVNELRASYNRYNIYARKFIECPSVLRKCVINPRNFDDDKCGLYAVVMALYQYDKDLEYKQRGELSTYKAEIDKMTDLFTKAEIEFPLTLSRHLWNKIEKLVNKPINIYGYDASEKSPYIYLLTRQRDRDTESLNLFLAILEDNYHFMTIFDRDGFLNVYKMGGPKATCPFCVTTYTYDHKSPGSKEIAREIHLRDCNIVNDDVKIVLPDGEDCIITYRAKKCEYRTPLFVVADFECIIKPDGAHVPCGVGYKMVSTCNAFDTKETVIYRGADAGEVFIRAMFELDLWIREKMEKMVKDGSNKDLTSNDFEDMRDSKRCYLCHKWFTRDNPKTPHFCPIDKSYRGCAHQQCVTQYVDRFFTTPVIFHNLSGYDSHLILGHFKKVFFDEEKEEDVEYKVKISAIHNNSERVKTFRLNQLTFIDSLAFLKDSLDSLVKNIRQSCSFDLLKKEFSVNNGTVLDALTSKGIYPYEYMNDFSVFEETSLPPKEKFFSKLKRQGVSQDDYNNAIRIWKMFNMRNMGDYHDHYLKLDVVLLAEVWLQFSSLCYRVDGLDPGHFVTVSSYTWSNMLKHSAPVLQLFSSAQTDMHLMIERGIRGGISSVCGKRFSVSSENTHIMYIDANNLYGWAMSQMLPMGDFAWDETNWDEQKIRTTTEFGSTGYIFEVDMDYPVELHDAHNDYPLAIEKLTIKETKSTKLIFSLYPRERYVVHHRNLKLYLSLGMKLKRVHRVIRFTQSDWLARYIEKNTKARSLAKNNFEKDYFKQLNNSVYGKTMENKRKHIDFRLIHDEKEFERAVKNPGFKRAIRFHDSLMGVEKRKQEILLDKPIVVGFTVLEMSKFHMYNFYYNVLKKKYNENVRLLYTDTDSFILEIKCDDLTKDLYELRDHFDFSDYPCSHPLYNVENKKVIGKFKDETGGTKTITEFIGLRAKMYSFQVARNQYSVYPNHDEEEKDLRPVKRAKGVPYQVVEKSLEYEHYKQVLMEEAEVIKHTFTKLASKEHRISTIEQTKIGLTKNDDKRINLPDHSCLSYGHRDAPAWAPTFL